jgi:hypothetical protein
MKDAINTGWEAALVMCSGGCNSGIIPVTGPGYACENTTNIIPNINILHPYNEFTTKVLCGFLKNLTLQGLYNC